MYRRLLGGLIVLLALAVPGRGGSLTFAPRALARPPAVGAPSPGAPRIPVGSPQPLRVRQASAPLIAAATVSGADGAAGSQAVVAAPGTQGILDADLSIEKIDAPDPVSAGATLVYTLNVSNAGTFDATLVSVADTLPPGTSYVNAAGDGWLCGFSAGTVTCTNALVEVGIARPILITVLAPLAGGTIENTATVSSSLSDPHPDNNASTVTTTVSPLADLSLTKTDDPDPVGAGGTLTYTLSVTNSGPSDAASVSLTDTLPGAVAFVSASGNGWSCGETGGTVTCTRATLSPGSAPDVSITVTAPVSGTVNNTASVTSATDDPDTGNNGAGSGTTVGAIADLSLTKTDDPDPVGAGGALTYTLTVSNDGPSPATSLTVSDTLPAGVAFVSASGSGWSCGHVGQDVTCTRASLAASATAPAITITATAPGADGSIDNTASVSANESDPVAGNNSDTETTTVSPVADLAIAKTDAPDPVSAGGTLTYTVSVTNNGPSTAADLVVTDTLPAGTAFVSAVGNNWNCDHSGQVVTCTRTQLAPDTTRAITITVTAPQSSGGIQNSASVSASTTDPVTANDSTTESTTVAPRQADLSITKSDAPDPVDAGDPVTYTLSVANGGPDDASSLVVTDSLPGQAAFVSATGSGWNCQEASGTVTCTRAALASGASAPALTIVVNAPAQGGTLTNGASVAAAESDPQPADNDDQAVTTVRAIANLSLVKADSPDPVDAGGALTYTLAVSNAGPSTAAGVTVTDTLPAGVAFVSASGPGWSCGHASGTVTCTRASLATGAAPGIIIGVTAPGTSGLIANTASVASNTFDPAPGNNDDTQNTTVSPVVLHADLSLTKADAPDPVNAGANLVYTLNVANAGPDAAAAVSVTDDLPSGVGFVSATGTGWTCGQASGTVTCTRATLAVGSAPAITITVTAPAQAGTLSNTASVASTTDDPAPGNNSDSAQTTVAALADLSIVKSDAPDPVNPGASLVYTLAVANAGPSTAASVSVTDPLPAGVSFVSATGTGWTCNQSSGTVTCTRATLAVGSAPTIAITVNAPSGSGTLNNTATVTSATSDPSGANNSDTETTTVSSAADLTIAKSDSPDPVNAGATLTYTVTVTNLGPDPAANLTVTDDLPNNVTFQTATGTGWTCNQASGSVTCTRATLAVGAAPAITITGTTPAAGGSISNTATIAATSSDPVSGNNSDTEATTVTPIADVSVTKSDSPDPVAAGATLTYTITPSNAGPSQANTITLTDTLPAGVTFQSASGGGWTCGQASGVVTCTRGNIPAAASRPLTITVDAPATNGNISNSVTVSAATLDPAPADNTATTSTTVTGGTTHADLSIGKSDSPDPVNAGATLTYTLSVTNGGPETATAVSVTDPLPAGASFVSATGTGWTCGQAGGTVTCTRASLDPGAAPAITVTVTAPATGGTISNTATVATTSIDGNAANNSSTETTTVTPVADLSIAKSDAADPVAPGGSIAYTLAVANAGPSAAASVSVTDPLPSGTAFVSATGSGWSCNQAAGTVTCTRPTLAVGSAPAITLTLTAPGGGGTVNNTATVSAATADPASGNNSDSETTTVSSAADLTITKNDSPDPVNAAATLTYTVTVTNLGPDPAANLTVTDDLPNGVTFQTATGTGWTCNQASGTVTCTRATLAVGAAPAITITVTTPAAGGSISNTATIAATSSDPVSGNNSDTETTTVTPIADVSVTKTDSPDPVAAGANLTYTITPANAGPSQANTITLTDTLPAGVTFQSATGTGWTCGQASGVVTCTRGNIPAGASRPLTITVDAPATNGNISNSVTITAATADPDPSDNTASASTTVTGGTTHADVSIGKADSPDPVGAGATLVYTLSVANAGPETASSLTVTDPLPAGASFVSATGTGWTCGQAGGTVTCTRATLAVGTAPAITVTVTAPATGGTISNTATVATTSIDGNAANNSSTETTTVTAVADLSIAKSDAADPVAPGGSIAYTLAVTNAGPSAAASVSVTDPLPSGTSFVSATGTGWTCNQAAGTVTCTRPTLAVGSAPAITLTVTAPGGGGTVNNTATVSAATSDPASGNNSDTETTTVSSAADLTIAKSDSPDPVNAGATLTYTLIVTNLGPDPAANLTVTDDLPNGVTFQTATGTGWTCNQASGTVTCTRATLAAGAAPAITITVTTPAAGGSISNTATIAATSSDPVSGNNSDTEATTVTPVADVSVTKSDSPDPVAAGATLTYTITPANAGPSQANTITLTDTLPAGVTFQSASGGGWTCGQASGVVTCTRGNIPAAASRPLTITVDAPATNGNISNSVTVSAATLDPDPADNTATTSTTVTGGTTHADLSIGKSDSPDPVNAGATLTYTLSVTNGGPETATAVSVTDPLPAGASFVSATGTGWTCGQAGGTVTCTRANLDPGAAPAITVTVTAPATGGTISNTASVATTSIDGNAANNSSTETTTVTAVADLSIAKTDAADPVAPGGSIAYTLAVTNAGPSAAASVSVSDPLPAGTSFVSATGTGWTCNQAAGTVTCTRATLAVGSAPAITLTLTAPGAGGTVNNTATVSAATADPAAGNNSDTETTTVSSAADLTIAKSDSPDPVNAGATLTYTLIVTNLGPDPAANLTVTDDLPNGVTFQTATGTGWTCNQASGTVTCTRATLAAGAAPAITITLTAPAAGGSISNTATIAATSSDPVSGNNSDTEATTVTAIADISVTKSDSPDPVTANANLTYTVTASNAGPSQANTITVTDTLPAGVAFQSTSGSGWTCNQASGVVTCTRGNIPAGASRPLTIVVKAPAANGTINNTVSIAAATVDPDPADNTSSESTTVTGGTTHADLSIAKSDAPDPVAAGGTLTYTLAVANAGPEAAASLTVTDPLPAGASFVSATGTGWTCGQAGGTVTCTRASLAVGAAPAITITVTAPAAGGPITNTATVSSTSVDDDLTDNSDSETTAVTAQADLSIVASDAPDPVLPLGLLTYTLAVSNAGPSSASSVSVTEPLPGGVVFVGATGTGWTCSQASGTVTCTRATLAVGAAPPITVTVTAPLSGTTLTATANVTSATADPAAGNNSDSETTTVSLAADASISMTDAPDPVNAGGTLVYTLAVANAGPDAASQLTVTDTLPAGVSFQSAAGSGWTCGQASGTVTCTRPTLAVGPAPAITITVTAPVQAGTLSNTATLATVSLDLNAPNNSDTESTTVNPVSDLSIAQADAPDPVTSGGAIAYTITVANAGPSTAASLTVTDTLPAGSSFVSASGSGWNCSQAAGVVTCTRPSLAAAGEAPAITVTVNAPANGGTITNVVAVSAAGSDPNTANNTDSETTTVSPVADVSIAKGDAPDPVSTHAPLTYTLNVTNAGPGTAPSVTVTDTLPPTTSFVSATGPGWTCGQASGIVTCTRANLVPGAAPDITIVVTAPSAGGLITNTASIATTAVDPTPGNNSASAETTVIPVSDLSIVKSDGPDPVLSGAALTYTLAVSNAGPDAASSVSVTDTLPAGVVFQSATGTGWSCAQAGSIVTCTRGSLAVGSAPALTIVVTAPSTGGTITNTAIVSSFNRDPDSSDNSDTESTTVLVPADLSIVKTDSPDPVDAASTLTYSLAVSNAGPGPAASVSVIDTLPAGVTFVSATGSGWTCNRAGSVVTCTRATLAVGAAPVIAIVVTSPNAGGAIDNTASVTSATADTNTANNSDTESTTVRPPIPTADLSITIADSPDPANSGGDLTYTLAVANSGPSTASAVTVTNTLPSGVLFESASGSGWSCTRAASVVTCTRASLAPGPAPAITIAVTTPPTGATLVDTATVSSSTLDPVSGNNSDSESTTVTTVPQFADLRLTQTDVPDPVNAGAALVYTLNVTNAGPNPASDVVVTDTLPAGAGFGSATGTGWTCAEDAGVVTCTRTPLAVGSAPAITITLVAPANGGPITNVASVASATNDPTPSNNAETETTSVIGIADLSIQETDTPDPVPTGQRLTATLIVANGGPSDGSAVRVTDTIPAGTTFVSATGDGWSCANASGTVTCTRATLPPGAGPPITLTLTAPSAGGMITNHASVAGTEIDLDMSDNQASRSTEVLPLTDIHDIAVTKITAPKTVKLTASSPSKTARVIVQIQNRGGHQEIIADRVILSRLVTLSVQSLGTCPTPTTVVNSFKLQKQNKLNVIFDVTFDCANDPLPSSDGTTHSDFLYVASVHREVIDGEADVHPADDVCPRSVTPPFTMDPYPNASIKDKGCGKKKPDKTKGGPLLTDVVAQ